MTLPIKENPWQRLIIGVNDTADKFVSGVVDTAEQFIIDVVDTADKHSFAIISVNFWKKVKMILMEYSGARGTLIHEKKLKSKILCRLPLRICLYCSWDMNWMAMQETMCAIVNWSERIFLTCRVELYQFLQGSLWRPVKNPFFVA